MRKIKINVLFIIAIIVLLASTPVRAESVQKQVVKTCAVRTKKSNKSKKKTTVNKGEVVSVQKNSGNWTKIQFNGKTGWVKKSSLKKLPASRKMFVKTKASFSKTLNGKKKGTVPKGTEVRVLAKSGTYSYISYSSKTGWVKTSSLTSKTTKKNAKTSKANKAVKKSSKTSESYSGEKYSAYIINGTYPMAELSKTGKDFASAVWNTIKSGKTDIVDIGYWDISDDEWFDAVIAMEENYFLFYGSPQVHEYDEYDEGNSNNINLCGDEGKHAYVDVKTSREYLKKSEERMKRFNKATNGYLRSGMTQKEKVKAIAKAVCAWFEYDSNVKYKSFDTCFKNHKGVCYNYATLFRALCIYNGIDCQTIEGYAAGGLHAWNQVKIGKTWYYIDTTWIDCGNDDYWLTKSLWSSHRKEYYFKANGWR